jgi:MYXO-CTERM domain-containing protein
MTRSLFAAALTLGALGPAEALACGGFFCSNQPIDQSKERIIFAVDEENGTVETHVQIFYQGDAEEFAWVVPVPSVPEVGVSSDELFTQLEVRTAPQFWLEERAIGTCNYDWFGTDDMAEADGGAPPSDGGGGGGGGVVVVASAQVGPYDQVTLQAQSAEALLTWLNDNGYQLPETVGAALAPYVADGAYFVALKLQNDSDAGDIAPVKLRYAASGAMIPLVLTAIAATPDMRLQPYVFTTGARAVPDNYLHVKINEAAVDWLSYGANYDAVVTRAANEAGGQAFATDYAGSTEFLAGALYAPGRFDLARLADLSDPAQFVNELLMQGFPRSTAVQNLIREFIPMPQAAIDAGIEESWFYNCLDCYPEYVALVDFDAAAFTAALDELIVTPLRQSQAMIDRFSYVTRMTSSMSPDEMTVDPMFVLNRDMGEVSNLHRAELVVDCTVEPDYSEAPRKIVLSDGTEIAVPPLGEWFGTMESWFEGLDVPAAAVIEDTSGAGAPVVLSDLSDDTSDGVNDFNQENGGAWGWSEDDLNGGAAAKACGGCDSGGAPAAWTLLGLAGLVARRRRAA